MAKQHDSRGEKPESPKQEEPKQVEKHRQCPLCWGRLKGVGRSYSSRGNKTYYKCRSCDHTWTVTTVHARTVIDYREVIIDETR